VAVSFEFCIKLIGCERH